MNARVVLGVSGASGAALALDCARALAAAGARTELVLSAMAERTLGLEIGDGARDELVALCDRVHPVVDLGAAIASGSVRQPCRSLSRTTIAAIRRCSSGSSTVGRPWKSPTTRAVRSSAVGPRPPLVINRS